MRTLVGLVLAVVLTSPSGAKVWVTVYQCDEKTPLAPVDPNYPAVYRDIMVGTRLVLVVSSNAGGYWYGRLQLAGDNRKHAALAGRGPAVAPLGGLVPNNYPGSCLAGAGSGARAASFANSAGAGFDLSTTIAGSSSTTRPTVAGDWFILDYRATQAGLCEVGLYDAFASLKVPVATLSFNHVPSRDFNGDTRVDFQDFVRLASHWGPVVAADPAHAEAACDLNGDARIDYGDLARFSEYWLARTDCQTFTGDPNRPAPGV